MVEPVVIGDSVRAPDGDPGIDIEPDEIPHSVFLTPNGGKVQGSVGRTEGVFLTEWAFQTAGTSVEIGSWVGVSTCYIARGLKAAGRGFLYAIDPHGSTVRHTRQNVVDTAPYARENVRRAGLSEYVQVIKSFSKEAREEWNGGDISFLFIDGSHNYYDVRYDFDEWQKLLDVGGVVLFDDRNMDGPARVTKEIEDSDNRYEVLPGGGRIRGFRKISN